MSWLRFVILALATLTFLWFAARDMRLHSKGRRVSVAEQVLHGLLGLSQLALFTGGFSASSALLTGGAVATAVFGAGDEYAFHRGIPGDESDTHAKAHWALFIFVAAALLLPGAGGGR